MNELGQVQSRLVLTEKHNLKLAEELETLKTLTDTALQEANRKIHEMGQERQKTREDRWELVDIKALNVTSFGGKATDSWKHWSKRAKAFCNAKQEGFRIAMEWAEMETAPIDQTNLDSWNWQHTAKANQKLHDWLLMVLTDDPLVIAENHPGAGFETWRAVARHYDPVGETFAADRMNSILQRPQCKDIADLAPALERLLRDLSLYEKKAGEKLQSIVLNSVVLNMVPRKNYPEIKSKWQTCVHKDMKLFAQELIIFANELKYEMGRGKGPSPMDVDALARGQGGGEDDDWPEDPDYKDYTPEEMQAYAEECQAYIDWVGKGGKKGKGGKGGKGKGGKGGKGKGQGTCHWCGEAGHVKADCRKLAKYKKDKDEERVKKGLPPWKDRPADSLDGGQSEAEMPDDYIGILDEGCNSLCVAYGQHAAGRCQHEAGCCAVEIDDADDEGFIPVVNRRKHRRPRARLDAAEEGNKFHEGLPDANDYEEVTDYNAPNLPEMKRFQIDGDPDPQGKCSPNFKMGTFGENHNVDRKPHCRPHPGGANFQNISAEQHFQQSREFHPLDAVDGDGLDGNWEAPFHYWPRQATTTPGASSMSSTALHSRKPLIQESLAQVMLRERQELITQFSTQRVLAIPQRVAPVATTSVITQSAAAPVRQPPSDAPIPTRSGEPWESPLTRQPPKPRETGGRWSAEASRRRQPETNSTGMQTEEEPKREAKSVDVQTDVALAQWCSLSWVPMPDDVKIVYDGDFSDEDDIDGAGILMDEPLEVVRTDSVNDVDSVTLEGSFKSPEATGAPQASSRAESYQRSPNSYIASASTTTSNTTTTSTISTSSGIRSIKIPNTTEINEDSTDISDDFHVQFKDISEEEDDGNFDFEDSTDDEMKELVWSTDEEEEDSKFLDVEGDESEEDEEEVVEESKIVVEESKTVATKEQITMAMVMMATMATMTMTTTSHERSGKRLCLKSPVPTPAMMTTTSQTSHERSGKRLCLKSPVPTPEPGVDTLGGGQEKETKPRRQTGGGARQTRMKMKRGITLDSGSHHNVMPRRMVKKKNIRPSPGSRRGMHYIAANEGRIENEGETEFKFETLEGFEENWLFQIAEVNKALAAIADRVDNGYRVVFDTDEETGRDASYLYHKKTKRLIKATRTGNVWVIEAIVNMGDVTDESFAGRG